MPEAGWGRNERRAGRHGEAMCALAWLLSATVGRLPHDGTLQDCFANLMDLDRALIAFAQDIVQPNEVEQLRACFLGVASHEDHIPKIRVIEKLSAALVIPPILLEGFVAPPALRVVFVRGADPDPVFAKKLRL